MVTDITLIERKHINCVPREKTKKKTQHIVIQTNIEIVFYLRAVFYEI